MQVRPVLTRETAIPLCVGLGEKLGRLELPEGIEGGKGREDRFPRRRLAALLRNVRRRLEEGAGAPLRVAVLGPTGAGKSKVFNSLLGAEVSPAGFKRPFTRCSVYNVHEAHRERVRPSEGDVQLTQDDRWRDVVLVDTPDFDSIEVEHRREADRVLEESEAVIFVTDAQKYGDHSTWTYLERTLGEGKPTILVLNKATGEAAPREFFSRVEERLGEPARAARKIVIPDLPIDDATLLPAEHPALADLRTALSRLAGDPGQRRVALIERLGADLDALTSTWRDASLTLVGFLEGVRALGERLDLRYRRVAGELGQDLDAEIDPGVKAEVYARVLERIQKIDVLRYPRQLLGLPFRGLRSLLGRWLRSRDPDDRAPPGPPPGAACEVLESRLIRLAEETRRDASTEGRSPGVFTRESFQSLRISHDEYRELYRGREEAFRTWLREQAQRTASQLTGEHKLKFILSQVIFNSVVVGVQIHTAGGFTLAEMLTDGVLSPLVAKAVGMAVSSEAVAKFVRGARARHREGLEEILTESRARFARHLESLCAWEIEFRSIDADVALLDAGRETVLSDFRSDDDPRGGESP